MNPIQPTTFPGWDLAIDEAENLAVVPTIALPKSPAFYGSRVTVVDNAATAADMAQLAFERPICHVGFDTEYRYTTPGVVIDKDHTAHDPRSVLPLILSLAFAEPCDGGVMLYQFVVDLRCTEVLDAVQRVLRLPVPFVTHFGRSELHCLWQLGLREPQTLWDSWVAEKVRVLGKFGKKKRQDGDVAQEIEDSEDAKKEEQVRLDLVSTCHRHGVPYSFAGDKERLQKSFLSHPAAMPFTTEQIAYAALDAEAVARLYVPQVMSATLCGDLLHLIEIEMPFVTVNARVAWHGVQIDAGLRQQVREACGQYLPRLESQLVALGVPNFRSHPQLKDFFQKAGLLNLFRKGDGYSFDKKHLKDARGRHPIIDLLYEARRVQSLHSDKILCPEFDGADGRVHADHRQLGADSGRQSTRWPNFLGLDRTLRPLIIPAEGCGIGEVDLSQIEIGVAAAVYGDDTLVEMFNSGDVYVSMAKLFYRDSLSEEDKSLDWKEFKMRHSKLRDIMKTCTLGIIYGLTSFGIAAKQDVTELEGRRRLEQFMAMFPALCKSIDESVRCAGVRGYAVTATGLKRYVAKGGRPGWGDKNWMRNHPVQGSAADAFKLACIRLDKRYPQYGAKLILPVHDAVVLECPLANLEVVAKLTETVLCEAVQELFPRLRPRAEINIEHPACWNKEGQADALRQWLTKVDTADTAT